MMNRKQLSVFLIFCFTVSSCLAAKVDVMGGFFSLNAKTNSGSANVSTLGSYRVSASKSFFDSLDAVLGYTINMSNTIGGDFAYGIDLGVNYFPFTFTEPSHFESEGVSVRRDELWRPYVGFSFNQRQFQSVKNGYAGFGVNLGSEYSINKKYSLKSEFRYISLAGSSESEATEMNILFGVSFKI
jgi:hypothetical protein